MEGAVVIASSPPSSVIGQSQQPADQGGIETGIRYNHQEFMETIGAHPEMLAKSDHYRF